MGPNHLPLGGFSAKTAWLVVQFMSHNLDHGTARISMTLQVITAKTPRRCFFSLAGRLARKARRLTLHLPQGWAWQNQSSKRTGAIEGSATPLLAHPGAFDSYTRVPNRLAHQRQGGPLAVSACYLR